MKTLLLLAALAGSVHGQTTIVGDAWITGQMGVSTPTPTARLEVAASSLTTTAFQVSGVDETPFLVVTPSGTIGAGITPLANLDVNGSADSGAVGLRLRNGTIYPSTGSYQIVFGYNGTTNLSHAIRTVHSTTTANSSMDFFIWNTAVASTAVGSLQVASLVTTTSTKSGGAVHIRPVGTPNFELVVSNGLTQGGGTVHRWSEGSLCSRARKTDIQYLGQEDELRAYREIADLKHASFRYKVWKKGRLREDKRQPLVRGVIYEDAPASIRGAAKTIVLDEQVTNAELAMKELMRRLEALEAQKP